MAVQRDPNKHCLELHRNLYGQQQAGRVWNEYLLKKTSLDLTVEGEKDFLGVHVEETNGSYTTIQPLLTVQILSKLRINEATASQPKFGTHLDYQSQ